MKSSKLKLICFLFIILRAFPFFDGYVNGEVDDQLCYLLGSWKENPALAELKATASHAGVPRVCAAPGSCASWLPQILRLPVHWVRIHKFPCYSKARQWSLNSNLPQPLKLAGPAPPWVPTQPQTPWAPFTIPGGLPLCCQHLPNLPPTYPAFHASVFWSSITPRSPQPGAAPHPHWSWGTHILSLLLASDMTQDGFISACLLLCQVGYGPSHTGTLTELPPARLLLTPQSPGKPVRRALPALLSRCR